MVVRDAEVSDQYAGAVRRYVPALGLENGVPRNEALLNVFEVGEVAVTTIYLPIDLARGRLFINQSYEGLAQYWRPRATIDGDRYAFDAAEPETIARKSVLIGGPIDGNYYHWMMNWLARIAILNMLRPDFLADPDIALLVDWRAQKPPYVDFLRAIGLGDDRIIWVDHAKDYRVRDAVLVSFASQNLIAPSVVAEMRRLFGPMGESASSGGRPRRIFISRQQLGPNRRRIDNIEEVRAVLAAHGIEEVVLEGLSIAEQIALFQGADFIGSVHGAGLTNIIFCHPQCCVMALDSGAQLHFGAALIYTMLAQACGLAYRSVRVKRTPWVRGRERNFANLHNQDLIVPPDRLDAALREMLGPAQPDSASASTRARRSSDPSRV